MKQIRDGQESLAECGTWEIWQRPERRNKKNIYIDNYNFEKKKNLQTKVSQPPPSFQERVRQKCTVRLYSTFSLCAETRHIKLLSVLYCYFYYRPK